MRGALRLSRRTRRWALALLAPPAALAAACACLAGLEADDGVLRREPLARRSGAPLVDEDLALARAYAPWVCHELDPRGGRQDLPAPLDFDGDLDGTDNWEHFPECELVPTLSYARVETRTHRFLTYHVFHPRDWARLDLGLHMTHEGDGENLQVVVEKASGRVVLLFTQAHYRGAVHARPGTFAGRARRADLLLVDDEGRPADDGRHAVVFVESQGHAIRGALDPSARVTLDLGGRTRFERAGIVLRPALPDEAVAEPPPGESGPWPYLLDSTAARLGPGLAAGALCGPGRPLAGAVPYADARVALALPRYHAGDRFSGPLGPSRGISPFAVDFGWRTGTLGALFFDPAHRYAEVLDVPSEWSLDYLPDAFAPGSR